MTTPVKPMKDPVVAMRENLDWLRQNGASNADLEAEMRRWAPKIGATLNTRARERQNANDRDLAATPQSFGEAMAAPLVSALDAGTFGLAGLATDALSPGDFRTNRDARQAAYNSMGTYDRVLSSLAGGLANPVSRVTKAIPGGAGMLQTIGRGALEGAAQGALTGLGENIGASSGVGQATALGAAGGAVSGAILTPLAKALASRGGGVAEDAARRALLAQEADAGPVAPAAQPPMQSFRLSRPVPQQTPLAPVRPNMPTPMAVDEAGPMMLANARGATSTVPGREGFRTAFDVRSAEQPRAIVRAFDDATSTTADDADELSMEIANAVRARDAANESQKASYDAYLLSLRQQHANAVANARAVQAPAKPQPRTVSDALDALNAESPSQDAMLALSQMMQDRNALAKRVYGEAWDETKGQVVDSDVISAILRTPMGQKAFRQMAESRPNISVLDPSRRMPTVEKFVGAELTDVPVPDAEALHGMKRMLSQWARLSPEAQAASGIDAKSASEALDLFGLLRAELPDVVRSADEAYATASAPITAMREGLSAHASNPRNVNRALSLVEERVGQMPEEPRNAFGVGQRHKIESLFRGGMSPKRAAELLSDPRTDLAREVALAYGPEAPARLAQALRTPDATPFQRPVVAPFVAPPKPQAQEVPRTIAAALRGVDVPRTPSVPSGSAPERSLPVLASDMASLSPQEAAYLQRGASAGFRREIGAGKSLGLSTPERYSQFGFAAKSPADAAEMRGVESAWDRAMGRQRQVLPSGQLAVEPTINTPLAALADVASPTLQWTGVRAGRRLLGKTSAANMAERGAEDAAFAGLMTGRPETLADVLANLAAKDKRVGKLASRVAGSAGRSAGGVP